MKKEDFKPGQTAYLLETRFHQYAFRTIEGRIREAQVLSVGRKYITVDYYGKFRFDINNGFRDVSKDGPRWRLYHSKEEIMKEFRRNEMKLKIAHSLGHINSKVLNKLTDDELQTIFDIIENHKPEYLKGGVP